MSTSIGGFVVLGAFAVIALLVLGASIWLFRWAWKSDDKGPAIRGGAFVGAGCILVTCAGCPAVLLPVFIQAREAAKRTECRNNVDFLAYALLMYANDNNDRLPLSNWTDSLFEYTGDHEVFKCPVLKQPFGYTFNAALVGKKVSDIQQPALVPLVFDGPGVQNSVGDLSLIQFRHLKDQACIGYIEGEAKSLTVDTVTR